MFKYSNKQQLGGLESAVNSPAGSGANCGSIFGSTKNVPGGNNYGYFRLQKHVYLKPKTAILVIA